MDNSKIDPSESKCWTCKHGLCMLQENTSYIEANFPLGGIMPGFLDNSSEPQIDWDGDEVEEEEDDGPKKVVESRVCSMCFWSPGGPLESPIITSAIVRQCSKYEK